jgi:hypothetical protein
MTGLSALNSGTFRVPKAGRNGQTKGPNGQTKNGPNGPRRCVELER